MQRSITIMGRKEEGNVDFAKLIYPPMQVADIFVQGINLPHAGSDQRKAQVIARDVANKVKVKPLKDNEGNVIKPVAIHHHLLLGLEKPSVSPENVENLQELWASLKMSKSKPDSCVFIHDEADEIRRKINKAYCPEGDTTFNPVLDWARYLLFREDGSSLTLERPEKFGGDVIYESYSDLEKDFGEKNIHPMDLKTTVAEGVVKLLQPAREHFSKPEVREMLDEIEKLTITR